MHIIPLADFGVVGKQLLGAYAFSLMLVDCEFVIPIVTNCCSRSLGYIESCSLWLRASDESR